MLGDHDTVVIMIPYSDETHHLVDAAFLARMPDGAVLVNAGHFPREIAVGELRAAAAVAQRYPAADGIETFRLGDGRRVHLLTGGHMVNLAGPRPLGNSIESMDLGFALQARCLEAVAADSLGGGHAVVPVPRFIDERVATSFLDLYGRSGSPRPGTGSWSAADGAGGCADDEGAGQHRAAGRAPGADVGA